MKSPQRTYKRSLEKDMTSIDVDKVRQSLQKEVERERPTFWWSRLRNYLTGKKTKAERKLQEFENWVKIYRR